MAILIHGSGKDYMRSLAICGVTYLLTLTSSQNIPPYTFLHL